MLLQVALFFSLLFSYLCAEISEEFIFENPPFASCHASTLTETPSGKLLCAYFAGSEEGAKDVGIWLSTRDAQGWGAPRLIAEEMGAPCWNPVLFTLPSGEILLFYKVGLHPSSWSGAMKRSHDEGATWADAEPLPAGVIGPVKNKPILLKDGMLLCGSSIESWKRWGCWMEMTTNGGKSWHKSDPINLSGDLFGIIQPAVFVTPEGTVRLLARSRQTGTIATALSEDGGKTWTEASATDLPNPNAGIDATALHTGQIALVYNHSTKMRTPLNLALSEDGGVHFAPFLILENLPGEYSYPSIIQTQDNWIHISYTFNRRQIKHVAISPSELQESEVELLPVAEK
jgi:predicted neuraminidase